jgi:hypothetical protein
MGYMLWVFYYTLNICLNKPQLSAGILHRAQERAGYHVIVKNGGMRWHAVGRQKLRPVKTCFFGSYTSLGND